jgi:pimeloyl-ACP methyl ester carboxylesterase
MFEAAPDRVLATVRAPVLAIYGSQDSVLAHALIPAAVAALDANPDAMVVTIPGMTHELQRATPIPGAPPVADSPSDRHRSRRDLACAAPARSQRSII